MTLKEIYKIIDESDCFLIKDGNKKIVIALDCQEAKNWEKIMVNGYIKAGHTLVFSKLDNNGGVEKSWIVDHIDKEKKIVKKKLDEMSDEEIKLVQSKLCKDRKNCDGCPFETNLIYECALDFSKWKENYFKFKDKEFEIEVEE